MDKPDESVSRNLSAAVGCPLLQTNITTASFRSTCMKAMIASQGYLIKYSFLNFS